MRFGLASLLRMLPQGCVEWQIFVACHSASRATAWVVSNRLARGGAHAWLWSLQRFENRWQVVYGYRDLGGAMRISFVGLVLCLTFLVVGCGGGGSSGGGKESGGHPPPTGEPLVRLLDEHETSAVTDQNGRATIDVLSFDRPIVAVLEDENGDPLPNWIVEYTQRSGLVETKSWDPTGDLLPLYYSIDLNDFVFDPETGEALGAVDLAPLGQGESIVQPSLVLEGIAVGAVLIKVGKAAGVGWKTFKVGSVGASLIAGGYQAAHFAFETNVSYSLDEGLTLETKYGNIRNNGIPAAINLAGGYFAAKYIIAKGASVLSFSAVEVADEVLNTIDDKVALEIIDLLLPGITDDETIIRFTVTTVSDTNLAARMQRPIIAVEVVGSTDPMVLRYAGLGDDGQIIQDLQTGLQWMRCSLGQTWQNGGCAGSASQHTLEDGWSAAVDAVAQMNENGGYGGYKDWRVPTYDELVSLVYCSSGAPKSFNDGGGACLGTYQIPTIVQEVFPDTPMDRVFVTQTPHPTGEHFIVDFRYGSGGYVKYGPGDPSRRMGNMYVRAVRAGL